MSEDQRARDEAWRAAVRQIAKAYGVSEELGSMDRGLMKRVRELSERRAEAASIKGAVGPQMDRWGMAAAAMGNSEAVAYREGVWIHHSLAYPVSPLETQFAGARSFEMRFSVQKGAVDGMVKSSDSGY